jgi:hypothetical protein
MMHRLLLLQILKYFKLSTNNMLNIVKVLVLYSIDPAYNDAMYIRLCILL